MQPEMTFTLTVDAQEIRVHYWPRFFITADYARFEFTSPHQPRRRIPVSETGYRSHFSPMHEVEAAPSVEEYGHALVLALMGVKPRTDDDDQQEQGEQLDLF
jgi:hypothetical protein